MTTDLTTAASELEDLHEIATHSRQTTAWGQIPAHFRHTMQDGTRTVLICTERGTSLAPWIGGPK